MLRRSPQRPAAGGRRADRRRPRPLTPTRLVLLLALGGSALFLLWGLIDRGPAQVPVLAAGLIVMGLVFAGLSLGGGISAYRSARAGLGGRAFFAALGGGVAALLASALFSAAAVLALLWRSA